MSMCCWIAPLCSDLRQRLQRKDSVSHIALGNNSFSLLLENGAAYRGCCE